LETSTTESQESDRRAVTFKVDLEEITSELRQLTPVQIMELAKVDPDSNYLVRIKDREQISYQDKSEVPIEVRDGDVFVTVRSGPIPVS
jgi:hypothetical protein